MPMKRLCCVLLSVFLTAGLLTACGHTDKVDPHQTYVFYDDALWEIDPEMTNSMIYDEQYWDEYGASVEGAELIDAILIDPDEIPSKELECNARTDRARIYITPDGSITVVLGDIGHLTTKIITKAQSAE